MEGTAGYFSVPFSESFLVHGLAGMRVPEPYCRAWKAFEGTLSVALAVVLQGLDPEPRGWG